MKEGPKHFYLTALNVKDHAKQSLYQHIGNDIGVERVAKAALIALDRDELMKPFIEHTNVPRCKEFISYLLGHTDPKMVLQADAFKKEAKMAILKHKLTKEHLDHVHNILDTAVYNLTSTNA